MDSLALIAELERTLNQQIARSKVIRALPADHLVHRPAPEQWNAVEIFEHMNLSSGIYVLGLEEAFRKKAADHAFNPVFKPGWLGQYSVRSMTPRADGSIPMRMKTLGRFEPRKLQGASSASIDRYIDLCERLMVLLGTAKRTDLNAMRISSSLGPIIRFKAGDAFRFPIAHQVRHFLQLERTLP
jgi:hypothetical protein